MEEVNVDGTIAVASKGIVLEICAVVGIVKAGAGPADKTFANCSQFAYCDCAHNWGNRCASNWGWPLVRMAN